MEIKIKHIEHAHSEYGYVGYIELTNNTKIWFGGMQPIKDEEEAKKVADLYVAAPLMLEALRKIKDWEMPETNETWASGAKMSYGACYGSNGERDYIKSIAKEVVKGL